MKRGVPLRRRAPLRPVSPRRRTRSPQLAKARLQVIARSGGRCEAAVPDVCQGWGTEAHHVLRRSQGGQDAPANLKWVCSRCHGWAHANVAEAVELGLLAHRAGPLSLAVTRVERAR